MKSARKGARLGQHFLTGTWAARRLAEAVNAQPGETILEIGPGKGALTRELVATGGKVLAIEKDGALVEQLKQTFAGEIDSGALKIITADIRDVVMERKLPKTVPDARRGEGDTQDVSVHTASVALRLRNEADDVVLGSDYVVAANIPYYITGEIVRQFLETPAQPRAMALLIQKEVADRIIARNGKESILSLSVKAYGTPKIVAKVSRGNFSPPPSVDSAIFLVEDISKKFFGDLDEKTFFKVVKAGFASKRKFLSSNLSLPFGKDAVLRAFETCDLNPKVRAEDVPLGQWKRLALELS